MDSQESEKRFPANPKDYKLYEEIGEGVSATVYRALCVPLNEIVAIKVLDLEKCNNDLVLPLSLSLFGDVYIFYVIFLCIYCRKFLF
jgi:serine/threonine protein kinase